jgi:hypothetical protein
MPGLTSAAPPFHMSPLTRLAAQATGGPAAPGAPLPPPALQGISVSVLRDQAGQLQVQLAGLRAQWKGLQTQLNSMRLDNPARPPIQQQAADVGVQMAQVQGQLATIEEQLALRGGRTSIVVSPPMFNRGFDPDMVVGLSFVLLLCVTLPFAIAFARRLGRRGPAPYDARLDTTSPRLDRIEQAVDAIAIEVERISEGQRFVTRLLSERPVQAGTGAAAEPVPAEGQLRALGAGPMQEIRAPQRQAVRTSNTPH